MSFKKVCLIVLLMAGTVGCDRVTKYIATQKLAGLPIHSYLADTLRLTYAENTGGFLSLGANLPADARRALSPCFYKSQPE